MNILKLIAFTPETLDASSSNLQSFLNKAYLINLMQGASIIIPAYNEESTIRKVAETALKARNVKEVMVVDDGSRDGTKETLSGIKIVYIRHRANMGKGAAMRTGLAHASCGAVMFLDGDITSITPGKINKMTGPVISGKTDFTKGYFTKPKPGKISSRINELLDSLFPGTHFIHPMSGQYCGNAEFFRRIDFPDDYGIDITILVHALQEKYRIKEVCLGSLEHRIRKTEEIKNIGISNVMAISRLGEKLIKYMPSRRKFRALCSKYISDIRAMEDTF